MRPRRALGGMAIAQVEPARAAGLEHAMHNSHVIPSFTQEVADHMGTLFDSSREVIRGALPAAELTPPPPVH